MNIQLDSKDMSMQLDSKDMSMQLDSKDMSLQGYEYYDAARSHDCCLSSNSKGGLKCKVLKRNSTK